MELQLFFFNSIFVKCLIPGYVIWKVPCFWTISLGNMHKLFCCYPYHLYRRLFFFPSPSRHPINTHTWIHAQQYICQRKNNKICLCSLFFPFFFNLSCWTLALLFFFWFFFSVCLFEIKCILKLIADNVRNCMTHYPDTSTFAVYKER